MNKAYLIVHYLGDDDRWADDIREHGEEKVLTKLRLTSAVHLVRNLALGREMVTMLVDQLGTDRQEFCCEQLPPVDDTRFGILCARLDRLLEQRRRAFDHHQRSARVCQEWRDRRGRKEADAAMREGPKANVLRALLSLGAIPGGKWCSRGEVEDEIKSTKCYKDAVEALRDDDLIETRQQGQAGGSRLTKYGEHAALKLCKLLPVKGD